MAIFFTKSQTIYKSPNNILALIYKSPNNILAPIYKNLNTILTPIYKNPIIFWQLLQKAQYYFIKKTQNYWANNYFIKAQISFGKNN